MSLDAISWAFQQDIKPATAKFVLVAMADRAGEDHTCFPSVDKLARDTSLNRKTVLSSINFLIAAGFIQDTNKRMGKTNRVIVYRLIGVVSRHDRSSTKNGTVKQAHRSSTKNGTVKQAQSWTETVPKTAQSNSTVFGTLNQSEDLNQPRNPKPPPIVPPLSPKKENNSQVVQADADPPSTSPFARFWQAYPRKRSKGQAEKVFKKINPSEQLLATILAGIERAKTSEQWLDAGGRFIPYPATWLNARGWEDEIAPPPLPPPGALQVLPTGLREHPGGVSRSRRELSATEIAMRAIYSVKFGDDA